MSSPVLETRNKFSALQNECRQPKEGNTTLPSGNILVVGDSQIRNLGRTFCTRDSGKSTCVCVPGAGVGV